MGNHQFLQDKLAVRGAYQCWLVPSVFASFTPDLHLVTSRLARRVGETSSHDLRARGGTSQPS